MFGTKPMHNNSNCVVNLSDRVIKKTELNDLKKRFIL